MNFFGGVRLRRSLPLICLEGGVGDVEADLLNQFLGISISFLMLISFGIELTSEIESSSFNVSLFKANFGTLCFFNSLRKYDQPGGT